MQAEQTKNLTRVAKQIAPHVIAFVRMRAENRTPQFKMQELQKYVSDKVGVGHTAPDSAGRILRDLRLKGVLDYVVVNRSASLYEVTRVAV